MQSRSLRWTCTTPYINTAIEYLPDVGSKLCFDRFHVARLLGNAVDVTRSAETKLLAADGDCWIKGRR